MEIMKCDTQDFKDIIHFNAHVAYLTRTDKAQKWTVDYTKFNTASVKVNGIFKTIFMGDNFETRKKINAVIRKEVIDKNSTKSLSKKFKMRLYYPEIDERTEIHEGNLINFVDSCISKIEKESMNEESLTYVCHIDQGELHIHRIFIKMV